MRRLLRVPLELREIQSLAASLVEGSGISKEISWRRIDTSSGASIPIRTELLSIFTIVTRTPLPTRKLCPSFLLNTSMTPSILSQGRSGACTSRGPRIIDESTLSSLNAKQPAGSVQPLKSFQVQAEIGPGLTKMQGPSLPLPAFRVKSCHAL